MLDVQTKFVQKLLQLLWSSKTDIFVFSQIGAKLKTTLDWLTRAFCFVISRKRQQMILLLVTMKKVMTMKEKALWTRKETR